jgi:plastocyanin
MPPQHESTMNSNRNQRGSRSAYRPSPPQTPATVTTVLPPGKYVLEINDLSTIHNFHLGARRAGVDVATDVAGTGETTTIVVLQDGEAYIYACDAHPATMSVTFSIHGRIRTQN